MTHPLFYLYADQILPYSLFKHEMITQIFNDENHT